MNTRKSFFLLSAFVCTSLLVGCNNVAQSTDSSSSSSSTSATVTIANASNASVTYSGAYIINGTTASYSNTTFTSSTSNQVVFLVINGGSLTLTGCTITKTGDGSSSSSGTSADDNFNFYGINSAIVAVGSGSSVTLDGCTVTTGAKYANAVFSCDGATITIKDGITIKTTSDSSRGLYATYAGKITADNTGAVKITTTGAHCASLATDRGGGTVTVNGSSTYGCTLSTAGDGSPCIYSTGTISASYVTGTSTGAQALVVEGANSISLSESTVSGYDSSYGGIMLYQSTSGDASTGTCALTLTDCTINNTATGTPMLFVTNTTATAAITNCIFQESGTALTSSNTFITCGPESNNRWGTSGSNGGTLTATVTNCTGLKGIVNATSSDSTATVTLSNCTNSSLTTGTATGTVTIN